MDGNPVSKVCSLTQELAQALQLEQVSFIKQQLLTTPDSPYLKNFINQIYQQAEKIQLQQFIQLEQLHQVVQKYAFDLNLGPELLEFIGVAAQKIHLLLVQSPLHFQDLCSDQDFENWLYKIFELEQVRDYLTDTLLNNQKAQLISLQLANTIIESHTPWLDQLRKRNIKSQSLATKVLNFVQDQQQHIELKLEQQLAQALLKQLGQIITLPSDELSEMGLQLWSDVKLKPIAETFAQIAALDLEDFFILVYESWKSLRDIPFMQHMIQAVVTAFYDYFAEYSLQDLLQAVGITEQDLHQETERFVPHALTALDQHGLLNDILNCLVEPFYQQTQTLALMQSIIDRRSNSLN